MKKIFRRVSKFFRGRLKLPTEVYFNQCHTESSTLTHFY